MSIFRLGWLVHKGYILKNTKVNSIWSLSLKKGYIYLLVSGHLIGNSQEEENFSHILKFKIPCKFPVNDFIQYPKFLRRILSTTIPKSSHPFFYNGSGEHWGILIYRIFLGILLFVQFNQIIRNKTLFNLLNAIWLSQPFSNPRLFQARW